jgi:hypothetical protein
VSFARARKRRLKDKAEKGDRRARHEIAMGNRAVKESMVKQFIRDKKHRQNAIFNLSACFLLSANIGFGFGRERLLRLKAKMQSEFDAIVAGNVSIEEIAEYLETDIKMNIGIAEEDPNADRVRQIEYKAVQQMSSAYLMALLDEFGFKRKRLSDAYGYAAGLSDKVSRKEITYPDIHKALSEVMERGRRR